jgi:hypothetical protein
MNEETMSLHEALRWALSQIEDDLDPDHQAALAAAHSLLEEEEEPVPVMKVFVRDQYGQQAFYPADETARLFAAIAGTKTITPANLSHILKLGYSIEYVHPPVQQPTPR